MPSFPRMAGGLPQAVAMEWPRFGRPPHRSKLLRGNRKKERRNNFVPFAPFFLCMRCESTKPGTSIKSIKLIALALALFAGGTFQFTQSGRCRIESARRKIVAWGSNEHGQLNAPSGNDFVAIDAGQGFHCLALRADGSLEAWGGIMGIPSLAWGMSSTARRPCRPACLMSLRLPPEHSIASRSSPTVRSLVGAPTTATPPSTTMAISTKRPCHPACPMSLPLRLEIGIAWR